MITCAVPAGLAYFSCLNRHFRAGLSHAAASRQDLNAFRVRRSDGSLVLTYTTQSLDFFGDYPASSCSAPRNRARIARIIQRVKITMIRRKIVARAPAA